MKAILTIAFILLAGCAEPMTPAEMRAAIDGCKKYDLNYAAERMSFHLMAVTGIRCEPYNSVIEDKE